MIKIGNRLRNRPFNRNRVQNNYTSLINNYTSHFIGELLNLGFDLSLCNF